VGTEDREITDLKRIEVIPRSIQVEELLAADVPATILPSASEAIRQTGSAAALS
jgi:hypothetical protein